MSSSTREQSASSAALKSLMVCFGSHLPAYRKNRAELLALLVLTLIWMRFSPRSVQSNCT